MNKNTIFGFVLIGIILIGFSWYNTKLFKEQERERFVRDSIAAVEALKNAPALDSSALVTVSERDSLSVIRETAPIYKDSLLEAASRAEEEFYTLENDKISVTFTTKGAQASQVLIKNYYTSDSLALYLMKKNSSNFGIDFYTDQQLNTADFNFEKVEQTDTSLVMRLNFSTGSYIDHIYTLRPDDYMMDFNLKMVGMSKFISKNVTQLGVDWKMTIPRLERGYDNEKNYSTIDYKFPGESSIEDLGLRKAEAHADSPPKWNGSLFSSSSSLPFS